MFCGLNGLVRGMVGIIVTVIIAKVGTISGVWHILHISFVPALMLDKEL
jgi:hypothetical protein